MTIFILEDIDAGETLRIDQIDDLTDLALTVSDEDGAATIHLTAADAELLARWLLSEHVD